MLIVIGPAMFSTAPRGSYMDERICQYYSKEVLVTNWQNRREKPAEPNDCIVPVLDRVNACENHLSDVKANFTPPCEGERRADGTRTYLQVRSDVQSNFRRMADSQLAFSVTKPLMRNYTSTYTAVFDLIPKHVKTHTQAIAERNIVPQRPMDLDLTRSYGNKTRTGTRCMIRKALQLEKIQRLQTTYAAEYDMAATIARLAYKKDPE